MSSESCHPLFPSKAFTDLLHLTHCPNTCSSVCWNDNDFVFDYLWVCGGITYKQFTYPAFMIASFYKLGYQ